MGNQVRILAPAIRCGDGRLYERPQRGHGVTRIAVIGAGAWGTTVAQLLAGNGNEVTLWTRTVEHAQAMTAERENRSRLPGVELHHGIAFTADPGEALAGAEAAFVAVPSRYLAEVMARLPAAEALISCVKGFGEPGLERLTGIMHRHQPKAKTAVLSGPNLAGEVARGLPAAAVIASDDAELCRRAQEWLRGPSFRAYTSDDMAGVEIGGAVKNIIALATGISSGLGLGQNAKATIITRGLHEMIRLGILLGGRRETFYGLSGLGDLVATCAGPESRNFTAGLRISRGESLADLEADGLNAEGIHAVARVHDFALQERLDLPICHEVYQVVHAGKPPAAAIRALMERGAKPEALV